MTSYPIYDKDFHPEDLVKRMADGQTDAHIIADWDIGKTTFYRWLREHDEMKAAFDRGFPKWEKAWLNKGIGYMESGNRDAFKYWNQIMAIKGGQEYKTDRNQGNVTNVHVNQLNVNNKSQSELVEILQSKLQKCNILGTIVEAKLIESPDDIESKDTD